MSETPSRLFVPPAERIEPTRPRRWLRSLQAVVVITSWAGMVAAAAILNSVQSLQTVALFGHLVFLAVGFGGVLAVELHGLAFLLRWVNAGRMATIASALDPLIWIGLVGLGITGVVLDPQLDRPLTIVKLGAVLIVALNGLWTRDLAHELRQLPADAKGLPPGLLGRAVRLSVVSQIGWWTAVVIGFLTTNGS